MTEFDIKNIKKIDGEYFLLNKIPIRKIREEGDIIKSQVSTIEMEMENLTFKLKQLKEKLAIIEQLLHKKNDIELKES